MPNRAPINLGSSGKVGGGGVRSLYFRERSGKLFEFATDGSGADRGI